jgi:DNA-binding XRE family transcriptional regulator
MLASQTVYLVDIANGSGKIALLKPGGCPVLGGSFLRDRDAFYAEVGRRVRQARERVGLTQDALASRVSLSRTSVTNIEKGRQKLSVHTLCGLAAELGVAPGVLLPEVAPCPRTNS